MKTFFLWRLLMALGFLLVAPSDREIAATTVEPHGGASALPQVDCSCRYTVDRTDFSFTSSGGTGNFAVTPASPSCEWDARSDYPWITVINGEDHRGTEGTVTVNFTVAANPGTSGRDGIMTVRRARMCPVAVTIAVHQVAGCDFAVQPAGAHFPAAGGSGSFDATASPGCPGPIPFQGFWVYNLQRSGSRISYSVLPNGGAARQTGITLALGSATVFTITQDAADACPASSFSFSPSSTTAEGEGAGRVFMVTAPIHCGNWTPVSTANWINIVRLDSGDTHPAGPGSVDFTVAPNPGSWRSGTIIVGGQQFWVYQNSVECPTDLICRYFPASCGTRGASSPVLDAAHSFRHVAGG